jgi:hypothetical protein
MKPTAVEPTDEPATDVVPEASKSKPAGFRPTMEPMPTAEPAVDKEGELPTEEKPKPKPAFRPTMKPKPTADEGESA